jgi:glycosyltransferase involved in cell wall biosynthesis
MSTTLRHLILATGEDAFDPKSWSGIPFSLRKALERRVEKVTVFSPSKPRGNPLDIARRIRHGGGVYPLWLTRKTLRQNAKELRAEIERLNPDGVLSVSSTCVVELGETGKTVFSVTDTPYKVFHDAYLGTIPRPLQLQEFYKAEAKAARTLDGVCFASQWACDEALKAFGPVGLLGTPMASRLHVTPLGSNWVPGLTREEVLARVNARPNDRIELLYLGKDWKRKGGPLAVEVAGLLHKAGHAVRLHIVGCRPELAPETADYVTVYGALYQTDPEQAAQLSELFLNSHFLIVPTQAECFGIVFGEAQGFALPPISRAVHALPGMVLDGVTGLLFDPAAPATDYVERILGLMADPVAYGAMAVRARDRFEALFTWDRMADEIVRLMEIAMEARKTVKVIC